MEIGDWFSQRAAAVYVGVGPDTFRKIVREGRGPVSYRTGRKPRYRRADLDLWLEKRRVAPSEQRGAEASEAEGAA